MKKKTKAHNKRVKKMSKHNCVYFFESIHSFNRHSFKCTFDQKIKDHCYNISWIKLLNSAQRYSHAGYF